MNLSVVIPTWNRSDQLRETLTRILECEPRPDEIVVHVDAGDTVTETILQSKFPSVRVLSSQTTMGPGGGRNKLFQEATSEWIVSFDDDSWPVEPDFFQLTKYMLSDFDGDLIACRITESGDGSNEDGAVSSNSARKQVASFVGCGCIVRRSAFLETGGYLPLRFAYGMEENDVAIKLIDQRHKLFFEPRLHVFHDCDRDSHHANARINAAQISNTILFAFLRYPVRFWPLGFLQMLNRVRFSLFKGRLRGICSGVFQAPWVCWKNRQYRKPVSVQGFNRFRKTGRLSR